MAQLFQCDLCKKQITKEGLLKVAICYQRTKEEIDALINSNPDKFNRDDMSNLIIQTSVAFEFDMCKDCYDNFKKVIGQL